MTVGERNALVERCMPQVRRVALLVASRLKLGRLLPREDFLQEAVVAALKAASRYDPARHPDPAALLCVAVRRHLFAFTSSVTMVKIPPWVWKKCHRQQRPALYQQALSTQVCFTGLNTDQLDRPCLTPDNDLLDAVITTTRQLPEPWRSLLIQRFGLDGKQKLTLQEIGQLYNRTGEWARLKQQEALNLVRQALQQD